MEQQFLWDQQGLSRFLELDAAFQWEFNRLGNEFLDYWSSDPLTLCRVGDYWTNLPDHTDWFTEESEDLGTPFCNALRRWSKVGSVLEQEWNEEFEVKSSSPGDLVAGKRYLVLVRLHRDIEDRGKGFFPYLTEAEFCGLGRPACDFSIDIHGNLIFRFGFNGFTAGSTRP
jgi:hypothetical protein